MPANGERPSERTLTSAGATVERVGHDAAPARIIALHTKHHCRQPPQKQDHSDLTLDAASEGGPADFYRTMFDLIALAFAKYDLFLSRQVAHFLGRLSNYQDRDGSVLDNTIVLFGSGASTTHNPRNLPTLLAGGTKMGLRHGTYWRNGESRMSNLHLSILRSLGIEQDSFADSTGTLASPIVPDRPAAGRG